MKIEKNGLVKWSVLLLAVGIFLSYFSFASFMRSGKSLYPDETPFVVVIPSYNNQKWYEYNLDSVFAQKYHNYRIIYLDDKSPDGTGEFVKKYLSEKDVEGRTTLIQNEKRVGSLANLYAAIWQCKPNEVVVCLDGDDRFYHDGVLAHLNSMYKDPNVWVTYGQFIYHDGSRGWAAQVPQEIIATNAFRDYPWVTTALRTFYAGLFQKIDKQDLLYNGEFYPMAGDLALMWPILEMAGTHSRFIPEVLYEYNVQTGLNDVVLDPGRQRDVGLETRTKKRYQPLEKLF